jgi:hypothetical protein
VTRPTPTKPYPGTVDPGWGWLDTVLTVVCALAFVALALSVALS